MKPFLIIFLAVSMFTLSFYFTSDIERKASGPVKREITTTSPPCLQMFYAIEKYAPKYDIPKKYAYGIAYNETRYEGPFQWTYNHKLTSSVGAEGPMQIMPSTAKMLFPEREITSEDLRTDIDFNVECSMKLLKRLHDTYGDWKLAFGYYNTGTPLVNEYAMNVYNFKRK